MKLLTSLLCHFSFISEHLRFVWYIRKKEKWWKSLRSELVRAAGALPQARQQKPQALNIGCVGALCPGTKYQHNLCSAHKPGCCVVLVTHSPARSGMEEGGRSRERKVSQKGCSRQPKRSGGKPGKWKRQKWSLRSVFPMNRPISKTFFNNFLGAILQRAN